MNKGLEALKSMWLYIDEPTKRQFALQDYKVIEKDLKVLEIIKKKRVNMFGIILACNSGHIEMYNNNYCNCDVIKLTQTEFNLIKEWLENE